MPYIRLLFLLCALFFVTACSDSEDSPVTPQPEVETEVVPLKALLPEAVFTDPAKVAAATNSTEILDRLIALIDASPERSSIHIAIYLFDYADLVDALDRADARGVKLHLMLDLSREDSEKTNPYTINQLKTKLSENAELVVVDSDAGTIAINHNKFALFSEIITEKGEATHVVLQTSHNFLLSGARKMQDGVVLTHDGLYEAYQTYWQDMKNGAQQGMKYYDYKEFHDAAAGVSAYFLPKRRDGESYGEDTIIEFLNKITDPASAVIRIGMSDWTSTRINIVNRLGELVDQGAKVELVVKSSISEDVLSGLRELEEKGAYLKVYNMTESGQQKINIHSKFMLIEGPWEGENAQVLITGSHNFTNNALRYNNETILLLKDHELYSSYITFFEALKAIPGL